MIENFWTTSDLKKNFPLAQTLGDLIEAVSKWAVSKGRVVCSITVNGIKLRDEEEEKKFSAMKTVEIQEFKIETQTPEALLDESLISCYDHLLRLIEVYEKTAYLFRIQDIAYADKYHETALKGFYHFFEHISNYAVVYTSLRGELTATWKELESKLPAVLSQVLAAYEKKDYHLVADLLEYDLLELLEKWKKEIATLSDNAIKDGPAA